MRKVTVQICVIFLCYTKLVVVTHIYEYQRVAICACTTSRKTDKFNCCVGNVL